MSWTDRIREAAYTSPSGARIVLTYEDVRLSVTKKTSVFEFPDADGSYVQDLGTGGRRYPLRVFFWGEDYDLAADAFLLALTETGAGKLEHPVYGTVDVVPFGKITRRDNLKTASNQAIFEVVFWSTIGLVYPTAQGDPGSEVLAAVDGYNTAAAETFAATPGLESATSQATLKAQYEVQLAATSSALAGVAETEAAVAARFSAIEDSISLGIDVLVDQPLTLGFQTALYIQTPARAVAAIADRLVAYAGLLTSLVTEGNVTGVQEFRTTDLYASTHVSAMVVAVVNTEFLTKAGAISAAEILLAQLETLTAWRDVVFDDLAEVDTGESYQQLQSAVALAAGFLVELSFSLKQERAFVVDRPRTIVDLAAELYGAIDNDTLNFLISSNSLTGDEIFEVPRGRRIVYYV